MINKYRKFTIVFILLLILISNIIAVVWFNNLVFSELEDSAKSSLEDMAQEQNHAISLIVENKQDNVKGIVDVITHIGRDDHESLYEAMDVWAKEYEIETIIVTDTNGKGITSNRKSADISMEDYFESSVSGGVSITDVYTSKYSDVSVLAVTAPIYNDGTIQGVIVAEYNVTDLASLLIGATDSRGSAMIVNSEGTILLHTYPFPISFENFVSAEFENGKTYESILNDFATSTPGDVTFSIGGDRKLGEYIPLGIHDWTLFFEISESALSASGNAITSGMIIINVVLLLTFGILIAYILWVRKQNVKQIEKVAFYDDLTGVSNLIKFKLVLKQIINEKGFDGSKYILFKGDIENFKVINEVYGMEVGDKVICAVSKLAEKLRGGVFEIARIGSDELLVFAEKERVENFFTHRDNYNSMLKDCVPEVKNHKFNFRYGRYFLAKDEKDVDDMISKVSIAHSYARGESGWSIWDYDEKFKEHMLRMAELTNKMEKSLQDDEFKMFLQPKYNPKTGKIIGAEALVRWFEQDGKVVYPNEFIPLFEKNEFIVVVDEYIFEQACKFISAQLKDNKSPIPISINFSRCHLQNPNFVNRLVEIANRNEVPTNLLEIELTETTIIENASYLNRVLTDLNEAGFTISIDDFGSGYSALGMLKEFKFNVVKLDRSFFITEESSREIAKTVITGIVNLITSLGSTVVAEGIEYEDQVEFLQTIDCYAIQGYYYAKPMNIADFKDLLDKN